MEIIVITQTALMQMHRLLKLYQKCIGSGACGMQVILLLFYKVNLTEKMCLQIMYFLSNNYHPMICTISFCVFSDKIAYLLPDS